MTEMQEQVTSTKDLINFGRQKLHEIQDPVERKQRKKEIDKLAKEWKAFTRAERKRNWRLTKHVRSRGRRALMAW